MARFLAMNSLRCYHSIETYAVCKAYATLKAIAQNANWDNEPLFQKLLPWFIDEAKQMVSEVSTQMSNH